MLLEYKEWGMAGGILWSRKTLRRGCCLGQGASGQTDRAHETFLALAMLLGCPVETRLDGKER